MSGVKGQNSGHNKKSPARHLAEGTYRKDRHGLLIKSPQKTATIEPRQLVTLQFTDHEKEMSEIVSKVLGVPAPQMGLRFSTLVHCLSAYVNAHDAFLQHGSVSANRFGETIQSVQCKNRRDALSDLQREMNAFAMSYSEQATLTELAMRANDRMKKPSVSEGKPLE